MKSSAKLTAVSFFALTALAGASIAFSGCTVTSGKVDDIEGGTGNKDSATPLGDAADGSVPNACPGNTKETIGPIVSAACQAKLDSTCCAELVACFGFEISKTDAGAGALDCNGYTDCTDKCNSGPQADRVDCQKGCNLATPQGVQDAYGKIEDCINGHADVLAACQN